MGVIDIPLYLCKLIKKTMGHGLIPVETLSDHSSGTNISKLPVA